MSTVSVLNDTVIFDESEESNYNPEFIFENIFKLLNTPLQSNSRVLLPIQIRDGLPTIWEMGGRNPRATISSALVVAGANNQLLDAVLFNKINRRPNGNHAMIHLSPDYNVYAGKIAIKLNVLAPKIKVVHMVFEKHVMLNDKNYGVFKVKNIYTDYPSIEGNIPCERLIRKLFAKNVIKAYFANGWSISKIGFINNKEVLVNECTRLINEPVKVIEEVKPNDFIDMVEDTLASQDTNKLTAALQIIDFEQSSVEIRPLFGINLGNVIETLPDTHVKMAFKIDAKNMQKCYNPKIMFNTDDFALLEIALMGDDKYAIDLGNRRFLTIRGYRG